MTEIIIGVAGGVIVGVALAVADLRYFYRIIEAREDYPSYALWVPGGATWYYWRHVRGKEVEAQTDGI